MLVRARVYKIVNNIPFPSIINVIKLKRITNLNIFSTETRCTSNVNVSGMDKSGNGIEHHNVHGNIKLYDNSRVK